MNATYEVTTRCECQASLCALLTADRTVAQGSAVRRGQRELAPAHTIAQDQDPFDIAWLCPFCGRNTMRTFSQSALPRVRAVRSATGPT